MTRPALLPLAALLLSVGSVWGQNKPSNVPLNRQVLRQPEVSVYNRSQVLFTGQVFDQSTKAVVVRAAVRVVDLDSNRHSLSLATNADGVYRFSPSQLHNFRIDITQQGYEAYSSQVYNSTALLRNRQYILPAIYLVPPKAPEQSPGRTDQPPTDNRKPPANRPQTDTTPSPKEVYLQQKLLNDYHVLPSPSAYALYYALNPGLKDMTQVPAGYIIRRPQTPAFTTEMRRDFSQQFKDDSQNDEGAQSSLSDSIRVFTDTYQRTFDAARIAYHEVNPDSVRQLFSVIRNDLQNYTNRVGDTRRIKAMQMAAAVGVCTQTIREVMVKAVIEREEYDRLAALGSYLANLVNSNSLLDFFRNLLEGVSLARPLATQQAFFFAAFRKDVPAEKEKGTTRDALLNDTRAFTVSVHLQLTDGSVVSDGATITERYAVIFYPPKLKAIKGLHIPCKPKATFGNVNLFEGRFEHMVIDTRTGKEMQIVPAEENTFDTKPAFAKPARALLIGDVNFTEIQILVKAKE
ncbi:hypothetical protein [Flavisolibacter nicotianae]|uniref:hypothetical protein n=1 Tax=Flavisolibacter nicotianae TaxID=2364882 RepID=UPI000EB4D3F9|nr:hypothetical protein [Flavisolibacter nicotianae]